MRDPAPARIKRNEDVTVDWNNEDGVRASILANGQRYAILTDGSKPGWSAGASQDGPVAKVLT